MGVKNKNQNIEDEASEMADQTVETVESGANGVVNAAHDASSSVKAAANNFASPENRQQTWESAKASPLAYSFFTSQMLFSGMPILIFGAFVVASIGTCLAVAAFVALFPLLIGVFTLIPVLMACVAAATFFWFCVVSTTTVSAWIYHRFYVDSDLEARISSFKDQFVETTLEIEDNASKEFQGYKTKTKEQGKEVRRQIESASENTRDVMEKQYNQIRTNGLVDDVAQDDGVLGGMAAKRDRVADRLWGDAQNVSQDLSDKAGDVEDKGKDLANKAGNKAKEGANKTKEGAKNVTN